MSTERDDDRTRVLRAVCAAVTPPTVEQLAGALSLHHLAVRRHLAALQADGSITEETEARTTPGRPRLRYVPAPTRFERHPDEAYRWLAGLLLEVAADRGTPREVGAREGRRLAPLLAATGPDACTAIEIATRRAGFAPERVDEGRRTTLLLTRCPLADLAAADPDVVCALHLGVAEGIAAGIADARPDRPGTIASAAGVVTVDGLSVRRPPADPCRLRLHRPPPADQEAS